MNFAKRLFALAIATVLCNMAMMHAQDKIVNPEISYAGNPRSVTIGGLAISGIEGYEDYMLLTISGLAEGQQITLPGNEITDAVKRYWRHGLFSEVSIAADSLVGDKVYLHIYLKARPRVSTINYIGLKSPRKRTWNRNWDC